MCVILPSSLLISLNLDLDEVTYYPTTHFAPLRRRLIHPLDLGEVVSHPIIHFAPIE